MTTFLRISGIACLVFLSWFTGSKLVKMAQIRGFISGPAPESKLITSMAVLDGSHGDAYWVAWDLADVQVPGRNRANLPHEVWSRYSVGGRIGVYYFPGDRWAYVRENTFASNENFGFDVVFLTAWLAGIAALVFYQVRSFRCRCNSKPPPLPKIA